MGNRTFAGQCPVCNKDSVSLHVGKDPKNRKRKCSKCDGTGEIAYCYTCGEESVCGGMATNVLDGNCLRSGPFDKRTGDEIMKMPVSGTLDLDNAYSVCSLCGEKKPLRVLFRCANCGKVFCDNHACEKGYALCKDCDEG